tara:strand:- start:1215 stop:1415 length:201 start_codon:yes stop_codon:yes gene_type:complete
MSEDLDVCSLCSASGNLSRLPSEFSTSLAGRASGEQPVGTTVREFIESSREDLKEEKDKIKKEEYK